MRELEMTGKTVEDALQAACESLGVDRDDLNVSYEVLEFPVKKLFKTLPARVKVTLEEPEKIEKPEIAAEPAVKAPPVAAPAPVEVPKAAPAPVEKKENNVEDKELDIAADARLTAAVEYLRPIFELMGAANVKFEAIQRGEATILKVDGEHVGALIGRRGETMESLSYLASLVVNRMEGSYIKLGLDVAGYRGKREDDLAALTRRICDRVKSTGYCYEMEPMNPYERHIIHSAVGDIEGVRSESKGEGQDRRVVIYSTDPNASNQLDRESGRSGRRSSGPSRNGSRGGYNNRGGNRGGYSNNRGGSRGGYNNNRGGYNSSRSGDSRPHSGGGYGKPSNVPPREFADAPRDDTQAPQAPSRSERIHDGDDFALFGKIEL